MQRTAFNEIYRRFKGKITDDMYMELTPGETDSLLKELLLNSLHNFEFPRVDIYDYMYSPDTVSPQYGLWLPHRKYLCCESVSTREREK